MMRVLLVVPRSLAGFMQAGFQAEGYDVDWTEDVVEAKRLMERHSPALVILDLNPNGGDQLSDLRNGTCGPPVLAVTNDQVGTSDGSTTSAVAYITKPFRFDELLDRVQALTS